jgi:hypothetical protein
MPNMPIYDIYVIKEVDNGYVTTIHDDKLVTTVDHEYADALSRLITHLTNKINELEKETK